MMAVALHWLMMPWSGAGDHHIPMWMAWHGRLMVLGWAICAPLGVLVARYYKVWPGQDWPRELDRKDWWHLHRLAQGIAVVAALVGLALIFPHAGRQDTVALWHARFGWGVMVLALAQVGSGMLRGSKGGPTAVVLAGDHYLMTRRRVLFEYGHKSGGYLLLALAVIAVALGLMVADAPRWMALVIAGWWLVLVGWAWQCQRAGLCIDTYQAIWGADESLPGNCIAPIGFGIARPHSPNEDKP